MAQRESVGCCLIIILPVSASNELRIKFRAARLKHENLIRSFSDPFFA